MSDWDATRYHRISGPQFDWGQRVIARLKPASGERILDLGCGTGRLTLQISERLAGGRVTGVDRSGAMLAVARATRLLDGLLGVAYVQADALALPFKSAFDAVFSAATLHWIHDHPSVFRSVFVALEPGGRFVAQCGGQGNLDRLLARTCELMTGHAFECHFQRWRDPWYFADPETTARALEHAGFDEVVTSLEEAPVRFDDASTFTEFISCVCIRQHLEALPFDLRSAFVQALTDRFAEDDEPFVLDYRRLNMAAQKPGNGRSEA